MLRRSLLAHLGGACIAAALAVATPAHGYTISDGNSSATLDPTSPTGMSSWTVNGVNQYGVGGQQSFYYSIGDSAPQPISNLGTPTTLASTNFLDTQYAGSGISIEQFTLITGGSPATLSEIVTLSNTTDAPVDIRFYEYVSLNLNGTTSGNSLAITNGNTATQTGPGTVAETDSNTPSFFQGDTGDTILNMLNGSTPVHLNDTVNTGVGNPNFAFEWDTTLTPENTDNNSYQVSINKAITTTAVVPLPNAAWMALVTLAGLAAVATRKRLKLATV